MDINEEILLLGEKLRNRDEYLKLKEIEKKMETNLEVLKLVNDFSLAQSEYNSCLNHFDAYSPQAMNYQKKLYESKLKLDSHPLVVEYYKFLSIVNEPLRYIEFNLLDLFKTKHINCKK